MGVMWQDGTQTPGRFWGGRAGREHRFGVAAGGWGCGPQCERSVHAGISVAIDGSHGKRCVQGLSGAAEAFGSVLMTRARLRGDDGRCWAGMRGAPGDVAATRRRAFGLRMYESTTHTRHMEWTCSGAPLTGYRCSVNGALHTRAMCHATGTSLRRWAWTRSV